MPKNRASGTFGRWTLRNEFIRRMIYNYLFKSNSETKRNETKRNPALHHGTSYRLDRSGTTYSWKPLIHRGSLVQHPSMVNTIERDLTTGRDGRFATLKLLQRVANSGPVAHETTLTLKPAYCYRLGKTWNARNRFPVTERERYRERERGKEVEERSTPVSRYRARLEIS